MKTARKQAIAHAYVMATKGRLPTHLGTLLDAMREMVGDSQFIVPNPPRPPASPLVHPGGNEAELSKTYPSAAISRKLFSYRPSMSPLARKCRSSYHVEVAETGCYRNSSDIGDRTQHPVGGFSPRRAGQHSYAEPDHSSASRG